ncbi:MAG: twin-arginine translocase TatA/TatE family subunit [Rhodospirillales bacterium]|nr:twin-arginine translocase TatA/TatE family subunit [Rhodospirillales bacterium]MCB9995043.1 twin-arginine translocase TatA/TatE family subunit [Rhodospirillales bacterium]
MAPSIWQILIVVLLVIVFFGKGKVSTVMEDLAKGIKSFKKGLKDEDDALASLESKEAESKKE